MPERRLLAVLLAALLVTCVGGVDTAHAQGQVFRAPDAAQPAAPAVPRAATVTASCAALTGRRDCTSAELLTGCVARLRRDASWCSTYAFGLRDRDRGWLESVQRNTPSSATAPRRPQPTQRPAPREPARAPVASTDATQAPGTVPAAPPTVKDEDRFSGTGRDLLSSNGLVSPWCSAERTYSEAARRNCEASGSTATRAAGDNVGFDKHIDTTNALGMPKADQTFASIVVTLMQVAWAVCVGITRGVFFLVELALSFNPLHAVGGQRALALLSAEVRAITRPLAMIAAPFGALWVLAQFGWARRQGQALKHALLSTLLVAGAVVVLTNPIGTVGVLLTTSQQIGLGIIGAVTAPVTATPATNGAAGAQAGLRSLSDGLIDQPLALLEFGDVAFGTDPKRLDAALKKAAIELADDDAAKLAAARAARTNLDLFQIWPAGSSARNSINDEDSLLRALCASDEDTDCEGPHAAQAEFRTEKGTWQRAIALLVITAGLLPVWTVLLFTAFKLLEAGLMCLVRLCQLVFVVPLALVGRVGNERVISYAGGFAGNLLASTAYSAFLALIFLLWVLLTRFGTLGFVGQWLLLATTLWLLVRHHDALWGTARANDNQMRSQGMQLAQRVAARHTALGAARVATRAGRLATSPARATGRNLARRARALPHGHPTRAPQQSMGRPETAPDPASSSLTTDKPRPSGAASTHPAAATAPNDDAAPNTATAAAGGTRPAAEQQRQGAAFLPKLKGGGKPAAWARLRGQHQALGSVRARAATAALSVSFRPDIQERRDRIGVELGHVAAALPAATGRDRQRLLKRGTSLGHRAQRLDTYLAHFARAQKVSEELVAPKQRAAREARFLDTQRKLRRGQAPSPARAAEHRDYPRLAALIGQTPREYRSATAQDQLRARARIDRELAQRTKDQREVRRPAVRADPQTPAATPSPASTDPSRPAAAAGTTRARGRDLRPPVARRRAPDSSR